MEDYIIGIDDAGRGPVIGPMILTGILIKSSDDKKLRKLGVKDSKDLTRKRRLILKEKIDSILINHCTKIIPPKKIDEAVNNKNKLNLLEADVISEIILNLKPKTGKIKIYIDCPSVSLIKWGDYLKTKIKNLRNIELFIEHKADVNHASVSAASILAKEKREEEMDKLKEKYPGIGSGYPSDPMTKKFLSENILKYSNEGIFRKSWATYKNALFKFKKENN